MAQDEDEDAAWIAFVAAIVQLTLSMRSPAFAWATGSLRPRRQCSRRVGDGVVVARR
jgi:hypothetical protein